MNRRAWQWLLVTSCVVVATFPFAPAAVRDVALLVAGLAAPATIALRSRRRLPGRAGWLAIAAGQATFFVGDACWGYYEHILQTDPFPSVADIWYLASYPLLTLGLWLWLRSHDDVGNRGDLIDAGIITTGGSVVTWVFLVLPLAADPLLSVPGRIIAGAYPVADLVLLSLVVRLFLASGGHATSQRLLAAGFGTLLLADTLYAVHELTGAGLLVVADGGYVAAYSLVAAAVLHPSALIPPAAEAVPGPVLSRGRLVALTLAALLLPGVLAYQTVTGLSINGLALAVGSAALLLLVVLRLSGLVRQVEHQAAELAALARVDQLTGVGNRRLWDEQLPVQLANAARAATPLSAVLLDIDRFKRFNDEFGHQAGDALLRSVAERWKSELRSCDVLARYGGEEFAILLPGCTLDEADVLVQRLRATTPLGQTCSAGVAEWNRRENPDELLARVDAALYEAKARGRDRTHLARGERESASALMPADPR